MRHLTYLGLLTGCLLVTAPLDVLFRTHVFARPGRLLLALLPAGLAFGGWDVYAISRHSWSYDPGYLSGAMLPAGLPLEEALFFLVVPLAAILTYQSVLTTLAPAATKRGGQRAGGPATQPGANGGTAYEPCTGGGTADEPVEGRAPR